MINAYYWYRLSRVLYQLHIPVLPGMIKLLIFLLYNSSIPFQAEIGKGSRFGYGGIGVVIHKRARLGKNVLIGSNVTVGGRSNDNGVPIIMNNVDLGTGAKILGNITIGEYAIVGANAVVIEDVPPYTVVVGVPAKAVKIRKI